MAKKKLNRIQAHAKTLLADAMYNGEQNRELYIEEVGKRFESECDKNGEVYTRIVKKEIEVDAVKQLASQVLGGVLQTSTKKLLGCIVDGNLLSEAELWDCWMEVKSAEGTILIRVAQADMMMVIAKVEAVRANAEKQKAALQRWTKAESTLAPFLKKGLNVGDAMRQLGLTFSDVKEA